MPSQDKPRGRGRRLQGPAAPPIKESDRGFLQGWSRQFDAPCSGDQRFLTPPDAANDITGLAKAEPDTPGESRDMPSMFLATRRGSLPNGSLISAGPNRGHFQAG